MDEFMTSSIFEELDKKGWATIHKYSGDLIDFAESICSNLNLSITSFNSQKLFPKKQNEVTKFSLSFAYGLDKFPLHTDGAEFSVPPRFVLLRALTDSPTTTIISDAISLLNDSSICDSLWSVKTNDGILETKLVENCNYNNCNFIRFNRLSMKCLKGNKVEVCKIIDNIPRSSINWTKDKTIVIDNWRVLHGRNAVIDDDYRKRIIERLQIFI